MATVKVSGIDKPLPDAARRSDRSLRTSNGFSYVEILVTVVLVGVTVIAALVGLQATLISGRIGTERSQMLLWVQEGAEALHRAPYVPCIPGPAGAPMSSIDADAVRAAYQATLDAVDVSEGVNGGSLVVDPPDFLSVDPTTFTERWSDRDCDPTFEVAAVRLTATSPEGTTVDLEVIIDG